MRDFTEVKDLSVYISNNPETKEILIKNGPHAGEKRGCVSFRGYHLNRVKNAEGKYEPGTTDFYSVTVWDGRNYQRIGSLLRKGMEVILSGRVQEREYTNLNSAAVYNG